MITGEQCPCCGTNIEVDSTFCQQCGATLTSVHCSNCGNLNELNARFCTVCSNLLPRALWVGPEELLGELPERFYVLNKRNKHETWVLDRASNPVPPSLELRDPYAEASLNSRISPLLWRGENSVVVVPPIGADGELLPSLKNTWPRGTENQRVAWLLQWLDFFESLPPHLRGATLNPNLLHVGDDGSLRLRHLGKVSSATLFDLAKVWEILSPSDPRTTGFGILVTMMKTNPEITPAAIKNYLARFSLGDGAQLRYCSINDVGRVRDHNEDNYLAISLNTDETSLEGMAAKTAGLYVVCDGMGGHDAGEVASSLAVGEVRKQILPLLLQESTSEQEIISTLTELLRGPINQKVWEINKRRNHPPGRGMGCTLVLLLILGQKIFYAHIGDSRLYQITASTCNRLTEDHNEAMARFRRGEIATMAEAEILSRTPIGKALTQAIGPLDGEQISPEVHALRLQKSSVFLLVSDGVSDFVSDELIYSEMHSILKAPQKLSQGVRALVNAANKAGGGDNITALAVHAVPLPPLFDQI